MNDTSTSRPTTGPIPDGDETAQQVRWRLAVESLTDAALQPTHDGRVLDFADHLAGVLAAVTANVGSLDRLLAGRPGSWEADAVRQLVAGTVGHQDEYLWEHRTRPVVVPLHVAELVEDRYGHPGPDRARDQVAADYQAQHDDAETDDDQDAAVQAEDAALAALDDAWRTAYRGYGQAFTAAVHAHTATLADEKALTVPVTVHVVDDPDANWWRPGAQGLNPSGDGDPLVALLWQRAAAAVPPPVDEHGHLTPIPPKASPPGSTAGPGDVHPEAGERR